MTNTENYGTSIAAIYEPLQKEANFIRALQVADALTRERIIWLLMQK